MAMITPNLFNLYFPFITIAAGLVLYYFVQLKNTFPIHEIKRGGKPIAFFLNHAGEIKIIKISDIKGRTFTCEYGAYQLLDDYRYSFGKRDIYFYHITNANPLSIESLIKIKNYLYKKGKPALMVSDVKNAALNDELSNNIGSNALRFLDSYYSVDLTAKTDVLYEASIQKNFRLKKSFSLAAFIPQKSMFWRNVAIVIINDRYIHVVKATVENEVLNNEPVTFINTEYGRFEVKDARTRYRKGKTNVYIVAVRTVRAE